MWNKVKCANCGLLSTVDDFSQHHIADHAYRRGYTDEYGIYWNPVCFVLANNLYGEIKLRLGGSPSEPLGAVPRTDQDEAARDAIQADRRCGQFVRWQPGFDLREHVQLKRQDRERRSEHLWRAINALLVVGTTAAIVLATIYTANLSD